MSRLTVEYNPEISIEAKSIIKDRVNPSMVSLDETTAQYAIDMCYEILEELEVCHADQVMIAELAKADVHYLEF